MSVRSHIDNACPNSTKFSVHVSRAVVGLLSDDNAIRYVLPVLWITGRMHSPAAGAVQALRTVRVHIR